uniref:V-type ATP synthase subunit C n=1 Tax=Dictyoglomus thermophilum TaxID=14 RepID=A0A7C3RKN7_DICTH
MYAEYLFLSTNLKAKFPKFIDKATWEQLINSSIEELVDFLRNNNYGSLLEGYVGIIKILNDDLKNIRMTVKSPYLDLMLFDLMVHDVRANLLKSNIQQDFLGTFDVKYGAVYDQLKKRILDRAFRFWQDTNDLNLLNIYIDLEVVKYSQELTKNLSLPNIKKFWELRTDLYVLKIISRLQRLNINIDIFKKYGINLSSIESFHEKTSGIYQEVLKEAENVDFDFLIKKYLLNYMTMNFKNVISGPEVVIFYFYNKWWELEDLILLLESKKNNIPKAFWERRLLKTNA